MKTTIARLALSIIDAAGALGIDAGPLGDGADFVEAARCVLMLFRAQKALNRS
jgi:hypothetical protein